MILVTITALVCNKSDRESKPLNSKQRFSSPLCDLKFFLFYLYDHICWIYLDFWFRNVAA